ncbi:hypothetical protein [Pseudarthrobacter sp. J47]|uniref:hypothetical protein n=1 Tax=Pseudarthrobacter sp. J47 TaxID=3116482 RepID=UPI002E8B99C1|nr:hypothetical protein [Pseudarthrobacter sp. J47]
MEQIPRQRDPSTGTALVDLDIENRGVVFPLRLHVKADSSRLVVLFNGAVDLSRKSGREFQRSSWTDEIDAHVVNFADPTIQQHPDMALSWGQGNLDHYYLESVAEIVAGICAALRIDPQKRTRLYFGSSAGGYQALVAAALDPGSLCVVNNPQVDWTRHFHESHINRLLKVGFNGLTVEELRESHPHRADVTEYMYKIGNYPETHFWVNAAFEHDILNQLNVFTTGVAKGAVHGDRPVHTVHLYSRTDQGHNPMFKVDTIRAIADAW